MVRRDWIGVDGGTTTDLRLVADRQSEGQDVRIGTTSVGEIGRGRSQMKVQQENGIVCARQRGPSTANGWRDSTGTTDGPERRKPREEGVRLKDRFASGLWVSPLLRIVEELQARR